MTIDGHKRKQIPTARGGVHAVCTPPGANLIEISTFPPHLALSCAEFRDRVWVFRDTPRSACVMIGRPRRARRLMGREAPMMDQTRDDGGEGLHASLARRIAMVRDRYEAAWVRVAEGEPAPTLADFLGDSVDPERSMIAAALSAVDASRRSVDTMAADGPESIPNDFIPTLRGNPDGDRPTVAPTGMMPVDRHAPTMAPTEAFGTILERRAAAGERGRGADGHADGRLHARPRHGRPRAGRDVAAGRVRGDAGDRRGAETGRARQGAKGAAEGRRVRPAGASWGGAGWGWCTRRCTASSTASSR